MIQDPRSANISASDAPPSEHVEALNELATERLRVAYSSSGQKGEIAQGREVVFAWVASP